MLCPECRKEIPDESKFCGYCGAPAAAAARQDATFEFAESPAGPESGQAGSENGQPLMTAPEKAENSKPGIKGVPVFLKTKVIPPFTKNHHFLLKILIPAAAVLVLAAVLIPILISQHRKRVYAEANALYLEQEYGVAYEKYSSLGKYEDAEIMTLICSQYMDYEEADRLFGEGSYEEAQELFTALGDFEDSQERAVACGYALDIEEAKTLMADQRWEEAQDTLYEAYDTGYQDSYELYNTCDNHIVYNEAMIMKEEGKFFAAYEKFDGLGEFEDAADQARNCIQAQPGTGEIYRDPGYSSQSIEVQLNNTGATDMYFKIYDGNTVVSRVYVRAGESMSVYYPIGTFIFKLAKGSGSGWFGETDLFGNDGEYYIMNGGPLSLEANHYYYLENTEGSETKTTSREDF